MALGAVVALALGLGAWLIGQQLLSSPGAAHPARHAAIASSQLIAFRDPQGTFAISYPSSWQQLPSGAQQVVLLAASSDGASLLVRKATLDGAVTAANLTAARKLTDRVVASGDNVIQLRAPQQVALGGLPGYLYLYTFYDPQTRQRGAHAHYFVFDGATMITLVFQALPAPRIFSLAPLFDRVAATFRVLPAQSGATTAP